MSGEIIQSSLHLQAVLKRLRQLAQSFFSHVSNTSKDGNSTASPGSLLQCLTTVKNFFFIASWNFQYESCLSSFCFAHPRVWCFVICNSPSWAGIQKLEMSLWLSMPSSSASPQYLMHSGHFIHPLIHSSLLSNLMYWGARTCAHT